MAEEEIITAQVVETHKIATLGPVVAILFTLWVFLLHASPSLYHTFPTPVTLGQWRIIALLVLGVILAAEAIAYATGGTAPAPEEEESVVNKPAPKKTLEYPPKITGVIYADTYIPVNSTVDIKMRTMLARTCPLCENDEECWGKVKGTIDKDDFDSNMECKEGLRELGASI